MHKILTLIAKVSRDGSGWMLLFKAGWGELAGGVKYLVDKTAFDLVQRHVAGMGNEVVFDYEHQTLKDVEAPAAGWIKELAWEDGVGIKARVEWNEKAAEYLAKNEYRYFSPVFFVRKSDRRIYGLHSSALTNTPKTKHLTPILAKLEAGLDQSKEEPMDRKQLIAALGLKEDATDAEILAAVAKLGIAVPDEDTRGIVSKAVLSALDLEDDANESTVVASINVLKQEKQTSVSAAEFQALKNDLAARDARDAVSAAIAKGKVIPAQKDWALDYATKDPDGFAQYVAKAPQAVPVDKLPGKTEIVQTGELTQTDLAVAGQMDLDPEDLKKYGLEVKHG